MLKTCEPCVHLETKSEVPASILGQECMCGHRDTRGQYLEENSQPLSRGQWQLITMVYSQRITFVTRLVIPKAKPYSLQQQLLHPSVKLANPALDPGRGIPPFISLNKLLSQSGAEKSPEQPHSKPLTALPKGKPGSPRWTCKFILPRCKSGPFSWTFLGAHCGRVPIPPPTAASHHHLPCRMSPP